MIIKKVVEGFWNGLSKDLREGVEMTRMKQDG